MSYNLIAFFIAYILIGFFYAINSRAENGYDVILWPIIFVRGFFHRLVALLFADED